MNMSGNSLRQEKISNTKQFLKLTFADDPSYQKDGIQIFGTENKIYPRLFKRKTVGSTIPQMTIQTLIEESFNRGDIFLIKDQYWICVDSYVHQESYNQGTIKQCNYLFRFQNFDSTIHEYWGILENPYSTTLDNGTIITSPSNKMKVYLPYNEHTKKIFIGKRLMTDIIYDKDGKEVGEVYNVSGFDGKTNYYGDNRLLVLNLESGIYNDDADNMEEMICNYIANTQVPPVITPELLKCEIVGSDVIKNTGIKRTYTPLFYQSNEVTVDETITPAWSVDLLQSQIDKITWATNGRSLEVKCGNYDDILGTSFKVTLTDNSGLYNTSEKIVKITSALS